MHLHRWVLYDYQYDDSSARDPEIDPEGHEPRSQGD